jgi:hypothetical protein
MTKEERKKGERRMVTEGRQAGRQAGRMVKEGRKERKGRKGYMKDGPHSGRNRPGRPPAVGL